MKSKLFTVASVLIVLILLLSFAGCGKKATPTPTATATAPPTATATATPSPAPTATAPVKAIEWKLVSVWPVGGSFQYVRDIWAPEIEKRSAGKLKIKCFAEGELVKAGGVLDFVKTGAAEVGSSAGAYVTSVMPVGDIELTLPGTYRSWQEYKENMYTFKDGELLKIIREAYDKQGSLGPVWPYPTGGYMLFGNFKVQKWADIKGKNIRSTGPVAAFLKTQGAGVVPLPGAEQYNALQRGVIDLTVYPIYTLEGYKLKEVTKYAMLPMMQPTIWINLFMNKNAWNAAPDDIKKVFDDVTMEFVDKEANRVYPYDESVIKKCPEYGIEIVNIPDSEMQVFYKYCATLFDVYSVKDEYCKRAIVNLKEYLTSKGYLK